MLPQEQTQKKYFILSVVFHIIVLLLLIVSYVFDSMMPVLENSNKNLQVINAMVMSSPLPPKPTLKPLPSKPVLAQAAPQKTIPQPKPIAAKPKPVVMKKTAIAILPKKQKKLQQEKITQQLLSDLKKATQHPKPLKHKEVADAFQQELKQLTAKSLQQQMLQEQKRIAGAREQAMRGVVDKYKALILQAIGHNWLVPSTVNKNLSAELVIHLAPGGVVLDVQIAKSSGDESLDRSAQAAVFKASPLPVPHATNEFEPFRQFVLKVKPETLLNSASWQE